MIIKLTRKVTFVQSSPFTITRPGSVRNAIDRNWEKYKRENDKLSVFNGDVIYVTNIINDSNSYTLEISKGKYSDMIYANAGGDLVTRSLFVAAYIRTVDEKIVLVIDNGDRLNTIGGMADLIDIEGDVFNPEKCLARELKEELGVDIYNKQIFRDFSAKYLKLIGKSEQSIPVYPIGILYEIVSVLTKEDLQKELLRSSFIVEEKGISPVFISIKDLKDLARYKNRVDYIEELFGIILSSQ